jgi:hypothetical protein
MAAAETLAAEYYDSRTLVFHWLTVVFRGAAVRDLSRVGFGIPVSRRYVLVLLAGH